LAHATPPLNPAALPHPVLLAAGAGQRFGHRPKGLIQRQGQPLIAHLLQALATAGLPPATVVLGHHAERLAAALPAPGQPSAAQVVHNPRPEDGQFHSLHLGLNALPPQADVLVLLCDLPLLNAAGLQAVLQAWARRTPATQVLVPRVAGQRGHPVLFSAAVAQALRQAGPPTAPRDWLALHPSAGAFFDSTDPQYTTDADTPEALAELAQRHGLDLRPPPD
jgi:CTP:molybdopterin cytidylyltransferase MocA